MLQITQKIKEDLERLRAIKENPMAEYISGPPSHYHESNQLYCKYCRKYLKSDDEIKMIQWDEEFKERLS